MFTTTKAAKLANWLKDNSKGGGENANTSLQSHMLDALEV